MLGAGRAFGILDGGRGLAAALLAAIVAYGFGMIVGGSASLNPARETMALQTVMCVYAGCCFFAAVCVWLFVPDPKPVACGTVDGGQMDQAGVLRRLAVVLRSPRYLAAGGGHYRRMQHVQDV